VVYLRFKSAGRAGLEPANNGLEVSRGAFCDLAERLAKPTKTPMGMRGCRECDLTTATRGRAR
jgi:hypothetical protein